MSSMVPGYQISEPVYTSPTTKVYRATQLKSGRPVYVKTTATEYPPAQRNTWFRYEYNLQRQLPDEAVVKVLDLVSAGPRLFMILEDFGGLSLAALYRAKRLALAQFFTVAISLTKALSNVHGQKILHKDVNPANVIYNEATGQLKLTDFSISARLASQAVFLDVAQGLQGTLAYISPEQTGRINQGMDTRSDLYSLGVTFFELLTGHLPFTMAEPLALVHAHLALEPKMPSDLPNPLVRILTRLMAKEAEDRYRSSHGLLADLECCSRQWQQTGMLALDKLGSQDVSEQFRLPHKLYGRSEVEARLSRCLEATPTETGSKLVLVSGSAGAGKSALVSNMLKHIPPGTRFISGKINRIEHTPYSALAEAFSELVRDILFQGTTEIRRWRARINEALGNNGKIVTDLVPKLELVIGPQAELQPLPASSSELRFQRTIKSFIGAFTGAGQQLILFLDDLHWANETMTQVLAGLICETSGLVVIGSFRPEEVDETHPLVELKAKARKQGGHVETLALEPLNRASVSSLIRDTFFCDEIRASQLAQHVFEKTDGNPFYITEYLSTLHFDNQIHFDPSRHEWLWNLATIKLHDESRDAGQLLRTRLEGMDPLEKEALTLAACLGNSFDLSILALALGQTVQETNEHLSAHFHRLIIPQGEAHQLLHLDPELDDQLQIIYTFSHDKVHQVVYDLLSPAQQKAGHARLGRFLVKKYGSQIPPQMLYLVVTQLNLGVETPQDPEERLLMAQLNNEAGAKAKQSWATVEAFHYFEKGARIMGEQGWASHYDLTLALHNGAAENAFFAKRDTEQYAHKIIASAKSHLDKATAYNAMMTKYIAQNRSDAGIEIALEFLLLCQVVIPANSDETLVGKAMEAIQAELATIEIENLTHLPQRETFAVEQILEKFVILAYSCEPNLFALGTCHWLKLILNTGNSPSSSAAYGFFALIVSMAGELDLGYKLGKVSLELRARFPHGENNALTSFLFYALVAHWKEPLSKHDGYWMDIYHGAMASGEFHIAGVLLYFHATFHRFWRGGTLWSIASEFEINQQAIVASGEEAVIDLNLLFSQVVANLMGHGANPLLVQGDYFDEGTQLAFYQETNHAMGFADLYLSKMVIAYLLGEFQEGFSFSQVAAKNLGGIQGTLAVPVFYFFDTLIRLELVALQIDVENHERVIAAQSEKMAAWAEFGPDNYRHKWLLIEAERQRLSGDFKDVRALYEEAIHGAERGGFLQDTAIGLELAARFFRERGWIRLADHNLRDALSFYQHWGALIKVKQLTPTVEDLSSTYQRGESLEGNSTLGGIKPVDLDKASLLKAVQAISGSIVLEQLLPNIMEILLENAGARRIVILFPSKGHWAVVAQSTPGQTELFLQTPVPLAEFEALPKTLINYVVHSQESILVGETHRGFGEDFYLKHHKPKAAAAFPLSFQGRIVAILYLENSINSAAFSDARLEIIQVLSAQVAIALENAALFASLEEQRHHLQQRVSEATEEIRSKGEKLWSSIRYAERIQRASLPQSDHLIKTLGDAFIIYKPKDIVSGDFYWYQCYPDCLLVAVLDATGHGVPGAFMSMIGTMLLERIAAEGIRDPAQILEHLHRGIRRTLGQKDHRTESMDGMDALLIAIEEKPRRITFAGAGRPLLLAYPSQGVIQEIKGHRRSLGGRQKEATRSFINHTLEITQETLLFLSSDGLEDQPNPGGFRFSKTRLKNLLLSLMDLSMENQGLILEKELDDFSAGAPQRDDITFMGIRLS